MCEAPSTIRRAGPAPLTTAVDSSPAWSQIEYTYDPSGRRIAKDIDGVVTKYLYDGDHCIAEYDVNDVLLRKYIYGPGVDQPICMIDVADANAAYYYHYDALGSVVALSDSAGDTVQLYEYDVYGQVAASDPNHPNPFLFTGRRYDTETGLYYYRARYYNASIGRFLQTDPIGYGDGINWYAYCGNNPLGFTDPFGMKTSEEAGGIGSTGPGFGFVPDTEFGDYRYFYLVITEDGEEVDRILLENILDAAATLQSLDMGFDSKWMQDNHAGAWEMAGGGDMMFWDEAFWNLLLVNELGGGFDYDAMAAAGVRVNCNTPLFLGASGSNAPGIDKETGTMINWGDDIRWARSGEEPLWSSMLGGELALLAHELTHAVDVMSGANLMIGAHEDYSQVNAITAANGIRGAIIGLTPGAFRVARGDPPPHTVDDYMRSGGWTEPPENRPPAPW